MLLEKINKKNINNVLTSREKGCIIKISYVFIHWGCAYISELEFKTNNTNLDMFIYQNWITFSKSKLNGSFLLLTFLIFFFLKMGVAKGV